LFWKKKEKKMLKLFWSSGVAKSGGISPWPGEREISSQLLGEKERDAER
jgi:hypothetical protein